VADYSEFPTTPTAWQEQQLRDWETITPLSTEDTDTAPPRRRVDLVALVPAVLFAVLALTVMIGGALPQAIFDGGVLWVALLGAGIAMLISELRKARRTR
jgi:Na+/H+ antiporter NhaD/arsenite permease-like protein